MSSNTPSPSPRELADLIKRFTRYATWAIGDKILIAEPFPAEMLKTVAALRSLADAQAEIARLKEALAQTDAVVAFYHGGDNGVSWIDACNGVGLCLARHRLASKEPGHE